MIMKRHELPAKTIMLDCGHTTRFRPPLPLPGDFLWCPDCRAYVLRA